MRMMQQQLQLHVALTQLLMLLLSTRQANQTGCGNAQCTMQVVAPRPPVPLKPKSKSFSHFPAIVNCQPRKSFLYTRLSHINATRELIRSRQEAKKVVTVPGITAVTVANSYQSIIAMQVQVHSLSICYLSNYPRDIGELI